MVNLIELNKLRFSNEFYYSFLIILTSNKFFPYNSLDINHDI